MLCPEVAFKIEFCVKAKQTKGNIIILMCLNMLKLVGEFEFRSCLNSSQHPKDIIVFRSCRDPSMFFGECLDSAFVVAEYVGICETLLIVLLGSQQEKVQCKHS